MDAHKEEVMMRSGARGFVAKAMANSKVWVRLLILLGLVVLIGTPQIMAYVVGFLDRDAPCMEEQVLFQLTLADWLLVTSFAMIVIFAIYGGVLFVVRWTLFYGSYVNIVMHSLVVLFILVWSIIMGVLLNEAGAECLAQGARVSTVTIIVGIWNGVIGLGVLAWLVVNIISVARKRAGYVSPKAATTLSIREMAATMAKRG